MGDMGVTRETVPKEAATEAGAVVVAVVVMTAEVMTVVVDTTAVVDTTVAEEADLLVWGKLHNATAPKVPLYTVKNET